MRTIYQKIGCIIVLYDEHTGRTINRDSCSICRKSDGEVLYKGNGAYVLLGDVIDGEQLIIESEIYQTRQIKVFGEHHTPYYVWMMPNQKNHNRLEATSVLIHAEPDEVIHIILNETTMPYRLLKDVSKGDNELDIYHLPYDVIQGRTFRIIEGKKYEDVIFSDNDKDGIFRVLRKMKNAYKMEKTKIFPVIELQADNSGKAFAILRDVAEGGCKCSVEIGKKETTILLTYNQTLELGEMEEKE